MKQKPYNTEEQSIPVAAEPVVVYGRTASHLDGVESGGCFGRMTVDEF